MEFAYEYSIFFRTVKGASARLSPVTRRYFTSACTMLAFLNDLDAAGKSIALATIARREVAPWEALERGQVEDAASQTGRIVHEYCVIQRTLPGDRSMPGPKTASFFATAGETLTFLDYFDAVGFASRKIERREVGSWERLERLQVEEAAAREAQK